jgi:6-phosphofructokinase 1
MGDDLDNRALGGVKIDVIMGRHAGFLTAASALARTAPDDGPHLIYLPERPFEPARFVTDVQAVVRRIGRCVVAVSEGIADASGTAIASRFSAERDSHGNAQLSGSGALGDLLAGMIRSQCGIKRVRADTFGYLQRSFPGVASVVDAREARQAGVAAVKAALGGRMTSGSVALRRKPGPRYGVRFDVVPLHRVARRTRQMPSAFIARQGNDVSAAFLAYARPIVGPLPAKALLKGLQA